MHQSKDVCSHATGIGALSARILRQHTPPRQLMRCTQTKAHTSLPHRQARKTPVPQAPQSESAKCSHLHEAGGAPSSAAWSCWGLDMNLHTPLQPLSSCLHGRGGLLLRRGRGLRCSTSTIPYRRGGARPVRAAATAAAVVHRSAIAGAIWARKAAQLQTLKEG